MKLLDFHTHRSGSGHKSVVNFSISTEADLEPPHTDYSVGIHPWFIDEENYPAQWQNLEDFAPKALYIGECGLDRLKGPDLQIQEKVFIDQIRLAERLKKPVCLHIVRCFSELLAINKILRPKVPMVVHGYRGGLDLAIDLLKKGFYLSFGEIFQADVISQMPIERMFIETDESTESIENIYARIALEKGMKVEELSAKIWDNWVELSTIV